MTKRSKGLKYNVKVVNKGWFKAGRTKSPFINGCTPEIRLKMRLSRLRLYENNPNLKNLISVKTKEAMKRVPKEKLTYWQGKTLSLEHRNNISLSLTGSNHPAWKGGYPSGPYPLGWNKKFKNIIKTRDLFKCQICGVQEENYPRKLDIHHKDYDTKNSEINNLVTLCRSCHIKTNANRESWKKYFGVKTC